MSSSSSVAPRGRVPAIGRMIASRPTTLTCGSGEEPTTARSGKFKKNMYGLGLMSRSTRYTSNGSALVGISKRCDTTHWKMSPAAMYSFTLETLSTNASRPTLEATSPTSASSVGETGVPSVGVLARRDTSASARSTASSYCAAGSSPIATFEITVSRCRR